MFALPRPRGRQFEPEPVEPTPSPEPHPLVQTVLDRLANVERHQTHLGRLHGRQRRWQTRLDSARRTVLQADPDDFDPDAVARALAEVQVIERALSRLVEEISRQDEAVQIAAEAVREALGRVREQAVHDRGREMRRTPQGLYQEFITPSPLDAALPDLEAKVRATLRA